MKFNHTTFFNGYKGVYGKVNQQQVSGLDNLLGYIELDSEVTDLRWAAYMLATVKHECADTYQPITERGPRAYFNKYEPGTRIGNRLKNVALVRCVTLHRLDEIRNQVVAPLQLVLDLGPLAANPLFCADE